MTYKLIKPLLFRLDPELAHDQTVQALRLAQHTPLVRDLIDALFHFEDPILTTECAGLRFINPIGMAAGFDKRAELVPGLAALGFGHIEVGTITPQSQPGNDRPRMFRLPEDKALINRMGFNSPGMELVAQNLDDRRPTTDDSAQSVVGRRSSVVKLGINIGKNKHTPLERAAEDYVRAFDRLAIYSDYVAINISSPNTPGLRELHQRRALDELLHALAKRNQMLPTPRPIFVKVSPDETLQQLDDVAAAVLNTGLAGFIAGNTTLDRAGLQSATRIENGGLSGGPLATRARQTIAHLHRAVSGQLPIIGAGGVMSAEDAYAHIQAGATLVQIYTGLVYHGPAFVKILKIGLAKLLRRDGFTHVCQAVGTAKRLSD